MDLGRFGLYYDGSGGSKEFNVPALDRGEFRTKKRKKMKGSAGLSRQEDFQN